MTTRRQERVSEQVHHVISEVLQTRVRDPRLTGVTVTGVDDSADDGHVAYTIVTAPAVCQYPNYNGIDPPDVEVRNLDDEAQVCDDGDADFITSGDWLFYEVAGVGFENDVCCSWAGSTVRTR